MKNVRACAMLLAFPDGVSKPTLLLGCAMAAGAALLATWFTYDPRQAGLSGTLFWGFGVMIVWANAGLAGGGLRREARATCLPDIGRTVLLAWSVLGLVTLLLPALVLGLRGGDFAEMAGLLAVIALWGCLIGSFSRQEPPVPLRSVLAAMLYLPIVSVVQLRYPSDPGRATTLAWLSAGFLGVLLAARSRWQRRSDARGLASSMQDPAGRDGRPRWLAGFSYRTTVAHLPSGVPWTAMRALLGYPFAPLSWQQRYVLWPLSIAVILLFYTGGIWLYGTGPSMIVGTPLQLSLYFVWMLCFLRLHNAFGSRRKGAAIIPMPRQAEELTELALLPAWPDAPSARRLLLWSVLKPQLLALLILALASSVLAAGLGARPLALVLLSSAFAGLAAAVVASTLRVLARQPLTFFSLASFAPSVLAWCITTSALEATLKGPSRASAPDAWALRVTVLVWLVGLVTTGLLAISAWRRFSEQPHPFLAT